MMPTSLLRLTLPTGTTRSSATTQIVWVSDHYAVRRHRFCYQSKAYMRLPIGE